MVVKTDEDVYHFVKQSMKIKEEIENAGVKNKNSTPRDTLNSDKRSNLIKYNLDYSKFENCIKQVEEEEEEEEEAEKEKEKLYKNNQDSCSHDHSKERQLYEKKTADKLQASSAFNEEGKQAFHEKNYKLACVFFRKGLIQLDYCFPETEIENQEYTKLEINLHLNMALAKFHMEKYYDCINECTMVLNLDKNNAKAYYRIGHAYMSLDLYKESKEHFLKAMELNPTDSNVKKSLLTLKQKVEMYIKKNKCVCSKIFSSHNKENSNKDAKKQTQHEKERVERNTLSTSVATEKNKENCDGKNETDKENRKVLSPKEDTNNKKDDCDMFDILKKKNTDELGQHKSIIRSRKTYQTTENEFVEHSSKQCNNKLLLLLLKNYMFVFSCIGVVILTLLLFFFYAI